MEVAYHAPVRPYDPITALNRRAAAVGAPAYAQKTADADYNGHRISLNWNDYRQYYVAEYFWAGRRVLARGSFENCLRAALSEFNRGAAGSSVSVGLREGDADAQAVCEAETALCRGSLPRRTDWHTWRHTCAAESVRDYANPGMARLHFDWELMQQAKSEAEYRAALKTKYGREYRY